MNSKIKSFLKARTFTYFNVQIELNSILVDCGIIPHTRAVTAGIKGREADESPDLTIDQKIGKVIIYIEENLTQQLSLQKLADEIELSKYQLIRGFQREKGTTPWKFLINKRIEKVKQLLIDGMSPGQAAVEVGFYDQSHLNKVFQENTEQTPKEYQEENFNNNN